MVSSLLMPRGPFARPAFAQSPGMKAPQLGQSVFIGHSWWPPQGPAPSLAGPHLGQPTTPEGWYDLAKEELRIYDSLAARTARIANQSARQQIASQYIAGANDPTTAAYARNAVYADVVYDVERFVPLNYGAYAVERRQERVVRLQEFNDDFEAAVRSAEDTYGILPEPQVITREVIREREIERAPDLTVPLLVGGGALALALILF